MARLTEVTFVSDGHTYKLALDFDDAELVRDIIAFDVTAERFGSGTGFQRVSARVEVKPTENRLVVTLDERVVFETAAFDREDERAEQIVEAIPPELFGDPILGCALKAGVSAVIGQAISCARNYGFDSMEFANFFRCMREHFGGIAKTAIFRAFRCILQMA